MNKLIKVFSRLLCIFFALIVYSCGGGRCSDCQTSTKIAGTLKLTQVESTITIGESAQVTVTLSNSQGVESLTVNFSASNNNLTLLESSCNVSTKQPSCSINIMGASDGNSVLSINAIGYSEVTSSPILVTTSYPSSIVIGNYQGLVFENQSLLAGTESIYALDGSAINVATTYLDKLYAGTANANVFEYDKLGKLWRKLSLTPVTLETGDSINSITISNEGIIYVGTLSGWVMQYSTISKSWITVGNNKVDGSQVFSLVIDNKNQLYAGTLSGSVYHYVAPNWVQIPGTSTNGTLDNSTVTVLTLDSLQNLYAGTTGGNVYQLAKSGSSWSQIGGNLPSGIEGIIATDATTLYAALGNGNVYKSLNSGTWSYLSSPDNFRILSFIHGVNGEFYLSTMTGQVYKSTDNCISWQASSDSRFNYLALTLAVNDENNLFAGTGDGSVFELPDGQIEWIALGQGSPNHQMITALTSDSQKNIFIASAGNVWEYTSNSWVAKTIMPLNNGAPINVIATDINDAIYVASGSSTYEISCNAYKLGKNAIDWQLVGNSSFCSSGTAYGLTVDNIGSVYVLTQYGAVYKNIEGTDGWQPYGILPSQSRSLLLDDKQILLAGGGDSSVYQYSSEAGSWQQLGINSLDSSVYSLTEDNANNLYAGSKNGLVYKKEASNDSWVLISLGSLDGSQIVSLAVDNFGNLYAATYFGNVWSYTAGVWTYLSIGNGAPLGGMTVLQD